MVRHSDVQLTSCSGTLEYLGVAKRHPLLIGMRCDVCQKEFLFRYAGQDKTAAVV